MCGDCFTRHQAWLDYRPPKPIKIVQEGSPRWNLPWGERVVETIRSQQALIRRLCHDNNHMGDEVECHDTTETPATAEAAAAADGIPGPPTISAPRAAATTRQTRSNPGR